MWVEVYIQNMYTQRDSYIHKCTHKYKIEKCIRDAWRHLIIYIWMYTYLTHMYIYVYKKMQAEAAWATAQKLRLTLRFCLYVCIYIYIYMCLCVCVCVCVYTYRSLFEVLYVAKAWKQKINWYYSGVASHVNTCDYAYTYNSCTFVSVRKYFCTSQWSKDL